MELLYFILSIILAGSTLFLIVMGFYGFNSKNNNIRKFLPRYKFAVIIPVRNEEKVIGRIIKSLNKSTYNKDLFDIYVAINNCTDKSLEKAEKLGANIIECKGKITNKAQVLNSAFNKLIHKKDIDAFLIFDADNIVDNNFMSRMNDALCEGYLVAQGVKTCMNPNDSWVSACYGIFFMIENTFYNHPRMELNGYTSINGTGFMIKKEVLKYYGFNMKTITEDFEFTTQCTLNNIEIAYVDDAITYDEQPLSFKVSCKQRVRWSKGIFQNFRCYAKKLFSKMFNDIRCLDKFLLLFIPCYQIIFTFITIIIMIFGLFKPNFLILPWYLYIIMIVLSYIIVSVIAAVAVIKSNKKLIDYYKGILMFPIFLLTWFPIMIYALFKKDVKWDHIDHGIKGKI